MVGTIVAPSSQRHLAALARGKERRLLACGDESNQRHTIRQQKGGNRKEATVLPRCDTYSIVSTKM
jgi:hypothetical protein